MAAARAGEFSRTSGHNKFNDLSRASRLFDLLLQLNIIK